MKRRKKDPSVLRKLRRLGAVKTAREIKPPALRKPPSTLPPASPLPAPERVRDVDFPDGEAVSNEVGSYYLVERVYPLTHKVGEWTLGATYHADPTSLTPFIVPDSYKDTLFLDTETTGLAGAGTVAFMIGVGFFARSGDVTAYVVRQYFMRDFDEEEPMLYALAELMESKSCLVTFNGKTFDMPLLQTRFLMNRMPDPSVDMEHIDLLHPARRLWRRRFGSVALQSLETNLLGLTRSHADVPGWLIPSMYHDFVRNRADQEGLGEMKRVFYHNHEDIVSMVPLLGALTEFLAEPSVCEHAEDVVSLGIWMDKVGHPAAEAVLRQATKIDCDTAVWQLSRSALGAHLKRMDRRAEAVPYWLQIVHTATEAHEAHVELAKFYEWHEIDLPQALLWTETALDNSPDHVLLEELIYRQARLKRKLSES